jgi:hypothetical protein
MKRSLIVIALLLLAVPAFAQQAATDLLTGVQDNSFLLEEAYNQDPGVVQHINMLLYDGDAEAWGYSFTQEWPIRTIKHQFSYTVPVGYFDGDTELGDITLNYRYQWIGDASANFAVSPRVSLILPTGEGSEDTGIQVGVPLSKILTDRLIAHTNLGATWFPDEGSDTQVFAGQSLIYAVSPRLNVMLEALWTGNSDDNELLIAPGIRWSHNLANGAQLVPGVAYVRADNDGDAVLLYLSYEK